MTRDEFLEALSGHTPGPWFLGYWRGQCHMEHSHGRGACKYDWTVVPWSPPDDNIRHICAADSITLVSGNDYGDEPASVVDARLMVAAPDLLRELIEARRLLREALEYARTSGLYDHSNLTGRIRAFLDWETKTDD